MDEHRCGVLLLRVWLEGGPDEFRARLTGLDTSNGQNLHEGVTWEVASSPEAVHRSVGAWLDEFLGRNRDPD